MAPSGVEEGGAGATRVGAGDFLQMPSRGGGAAGVAAGEPFAQFGDSADADARVGLSSPARSDSGSGPGMIIGPAGLRARMIRPSAPYSQRCGVCAAPAAWTWSKT